MRRLRLIPALFAALALLITGAFASGVSAKIVQAFPEDGTLFVYVGIAGQDAPLTKADGRLGERVLTSSGALITVQQADSPVECMLLVDISGSMPDYRNELEAFWAALTEQSGENVSFTVATFGDTFKVEGEGLSAAEALEKLDAIRFNAHNTRIYSGISDAFDYFAGRTERGGALREIILLTDAVEDSGNEESPSHEALLERLGQAPVLLHTVCFGEDTVSIERLSSLTLASGGIHYAPDASVLDAAISIASSVDTLTVAKFSLDSLPEMGDSEQLSITFASGAEPVCKAAATVWFRLSDIEPAVPGETSTPEESPSHSAPPAILPSVSGASGTAAAPTPAPEKSDGFPIALVAVAAVLIIMVAAVVLLRKKPKAASEAAPGIFMRIDVLRGDYKGKSTELSLAGSLAIGSGRDANIRFGGAQMPERSARVFEHGGAVYIEDLSGAGTLVNGLRIDQPNILRSGDEISTGGAVFCLKF